MTELRASLDFREVATLRRQFELWAADQIPFAAAGALTDTARQARDLVRENLPAHFEVRTSTLKNAVQHKGAKKRDRPIHSIVHTAEFAPFLTLHATGGVKRPTRARTVAVPLRVVTRQRTASGRIPKRLKPATLIRSKGFVPPIIERERAIAVKKRKQILRYHFLIRAARIKKVWPFQKEVQEVVSRSLAANFRTRADQAMATRRR